MLATAKLKEEKATYSGELQEQNLSVTGTTSEPV
jgi:hypothetical protein